MSVLLNVTAPVVASVPIPLIAPVRSADPDSVTVTLSSFTVPAFWLQTPAKLLAAANSRVPPPISICSTVSASPDFSVVVPVSNAAVPAPDRLPANEFETP